MLARDLKSEELRRRCKNGPRGPHFPCIMGHAQQYRSVSPPCFEWNSFLTSAQTPELARWDRENRGAVLAFQKLPVVVALV
jgi:hypothetical protein